MENNDLENSDLENSDLENNDLEVGSEDEDMIKLLLDGHVANEANLRNRSLPSIYMVPSLLRDVSPNSFNPRVVSIGPLHREDVNLQAYEEQKSSYLISLMSYMINYSKEDIWKTCMQRAYISMSRIKACYVWPKNKNYSDVQIAEMMVVDACYILEFTYRLHLYGLSRLDQIYSEDRMQLNNVTDDLLLLENQIPLFFLDEIYHCTILRFAPDVSLIELIHPLLYTKINSIFFEGMEIENVYISASDHILGLLHQCYKPQDNPEEVVASSRIHPATDLDMAGVDFKPSEDPEWVMGIKITQDRRFPYLFGSWSYNTTLTMPLLLIHDSTEVTFRNLIAFEQSYMTRMYFTSYVTAMNMLVNTHEDVAKLIDSGVLINIMGSNEEAANMINNLGKNITVNTFYEEEWKRVIKYSNAYWPKHIAKMRSTYFRSPWSIIALLAGSILFVLQVVQTIFTINSS